MRYADLHIHSSYSDGKLSPEEIVDIARSQGLRYISITDHDTIESQYITRIKTEGINVIPGIEFSTEFNEEEIHILGYFIDLDNIKLIESVNKLKKSRSERAEKIIEKLRINNINITKEDLIQYESSNMGRAHIANVMVDKGYVKNFKEAFSKYLMKGKVAYVKGEKLSYKETLKIINDSGGIASLAHPGKIYRSLNIENIIKELKCYGLKGIEVYHPSHNKEQINMFYNLSRKYKLIITGGSDFHSLGNKDSMLGNEGINELLLEKLINFNHK